MAIGATSTFDDCGQSMSEREIKICDIFCRWDQDERGRGTQQLTLYCRSLGESERQVLKDHGRGDDMYKSYLLHRQE